MSADDVNIHHNRRNPFDATRRALHSLHGRAITNTAREFNDSMMHFDTNRIVTKVAFAFELHAHIMLKLYFVFHRQLPSRHEA
jgi:hypothetical protein